MSGWASGGATQRPRHAGGNQQYGDLGASSTNTQAFMHGGQDQFDDEVGALSQAVGRLKGMVTAIGEEAKETGKIQDIVAKQLEAGQEMLAAGTRKMKRMHREMTGSCGNMLVLSLYAVVLVLFVIFMTRLRKLFKWIF